MQLGLSGGVAGDRLLIKATQMECHTPAPWILMNCPGDRLLIKAHCIMKAIIDELPHRKSPLARNGALKAIDQRHTLDLHEEDRTRWNATRLPHGY